MKRLVLVVLLVTGCGGDADRVIEKSKECRARGGAPITVVEREPFLNGTIPNRLEVICLSPEVLR